MPTGLPSTKSLDAGSYGVLSSSLPAIDPVSLLFPEVDPREWFADPSLPLEIEIGSGRGTFLVQEAAVHPGTNYLGIERALGYYRFSADRCRRHALENARILGGDALGFIEHRLPGARVDSIHLYFSDPWPKARHHKRRVIQDHTLEHMHRVLVPGGTLRLVTDHEDLWTWYEDHASRNDHLFRQTPYHPPRSAGNGELVGSNYERKFMARGRTFLGMTLQRREHASAAS